MDFTLTVVLTLAVVAVYGTSVPQRLAYPFASRSAKSDSNLGIYDGQKTTIEKHPYITNLLVLNGVLNCSATIVGNKWVVTIASCVYNLPTDSMKVVAGSNDGGSGEIFSVKKTLVHPKFSNNDYNVAVVNINGKFTWSEKIKAIKLPKGAPKDNTTMIIAGYGKTKRLINGVSNGELLQGEMKWLPHKTCEEIYSQYLPVFTDRMNCAYNQNKTTPCRGDWADAFVHKNVFYGMFTAGISQGFCTSDAQPVLTTSIAPVAKWIKKNTGALYEDEFSTVK